jgi:hypothetical protein
MRSTAGINLSLFCACLVLSTAPVAAQTFTQGDYTYTVEDGTTTITSFNPLYSGALSITNTLDGYPVTSIDYYAFSDCTGLTSVMIPDSVTNIGDYAFYCCSGLVAITVDPLNPAYSSTNGVLFNKSQTTLIQYPGGKTGTYVIPDSVTSIGSYAFSYCTGLDNVVIPNSVTSITSVSFMYCKGLAGLYFKGNAPSFGMGGSRSLSGVIYYLPGSSGWDGRFLGKTPILWDPQVQGGDGFGMKENHFGFTITNVGSPVVVVEACTNLSSSVWTPVSTNTLTGGSSVFSDPNWTNYPARFYRFNMP